MTSYKLANYIILRHFAVRNKCLPCLLVSDRHICSKDNEIKTDNNSSKDSSSRGKEELDEESKPAESLSIKADDSDDPVKSAAKIKLMSLLSSIKVASTEPVNRTSNLNLAKPVKHPSRKERLKKIEAEEITPKKEMDMAIKAVASNFKGDSEKIESELTTKVNSLEMSKEAFPEEETNEEDPEIEKINKNLMSSVEEVADTISESPIPPRSELTKRLMRLSLNQNIGSEKKSLRSMIQGMNIQSNESALPPKAKLEPRKKEIRFPNHKKIEKINLFGSTPLNIFTPDAEIKEDSTNTFWRKLQERELQLLTHFAPANAFEEMIMWTEQGKHWKFPIDNETEMGDEENVGFHEHVFLDRHLKGFPTKGPIRHFMELVVVGLSKNPYITVGRKLENIEWFRTYFKEKEELLREEGAIV